MNKYSVLSIAFNICAIILYIAGIILITSSQQPSPGIVFIPAGFAFSSAGIFVGRKAKEDANKKNEEDEEENEKKDNE
ncbi:MAG: hypothetical protein J6V22_03035 [Clostridia bacterium]|nr:hypothetical protein [Clostridia bacterium]